MNAQHITQDCLLSVLDCLEANDIAVAGLAKELRVSRQAVYHSINGEGSRRIRVKIAHLLNKKPSELWLDNAPEKLKIDDLFYASNIHNGDVA